MSIDRIGLYYHEAGYVSLDFDVDSFSSAALFYNWPREFVIAPNEDGFIVIFQYVYHSLRMCMNYISNNTNEYKRVRISDDTDSFRDGPEFPKYFWSTKSTHKSQIDTYDDRLLAVFQYYTGSKIDPFLMYDVIINRLPADEMEEEWHMINTDNLIYFSLDLFDFEGMNMPNYPNVDIENINNLLEM